jgi:hypothetical protein
MIVISGENVETPAQSESSRKYRAPQYGHFASPVASTGR